MSRKRSKKPMTLRAVRAMLKRMTRCQIHFDVTEPMVDMLEELGSSGLFGPGDKHGVALRLVEDGLRRYQSEGIFLRRLKRR